MPKLYTLPVTLILMKKVIYILNLSYKITVSIVLINVS